MGALRRSHAPPQDEGQERSRRGVRTSAAAARSPRCVSMTHSRRWSQETRDAVGRDSGPDARARGVQGAARACRRSEPPGLRLAVVVTGVSSARVAAAGCRRLNVRSHVDLASARPSSVGKAVRRSTTGGDDEVPDAGVLGRREDERPGRARPERPPTEEGFPWLDDLQERGIWVTGDQLAPPRRARSVRVRGGKTMVTDGPFAETKEAVGGFDILECSSLEEAVEIAAGIPAPRWARSRCGHSGGTDHPSKVKARPGWSRMVVPAAEHHPVPLPAMRFPLSHRECSAPAESSSIMASERVAWRAIARRALRERAAGHDRPLRGDRFAGDHRRRAAQAELRDLPGARARRLAPDGVVIPFEDGHTRQLPRLTAGPFRYATYADAYLARRGGTRRARLSRR